jgi:crotonobetainyl-CoA:carnitine CoA-transferase CaiB-like acyl-CoA transferase
LAKKSDVVVSNFRPGVMEKLGFGFDDLSKINPRIIVAYGSGYGQTGPDRETLGQDMMAQCRGGIIRGDPPRTPGYNLCDQFGGLMLAQGIMLALAAREKTGRGQVVDTCLLNTALVADSMGATAYLNRPAPPVARPKTGNPTYALYQAKDGKWVHIIDAFRDRPLQRQCRALAIPDRVANDPRFADVHKLTPEAFGELRAHLAAGVARFTADEVIARMKEQDMMAVKVCGYDEVFTDPQVLHNQMILDAEHPVAGQMKLVGFPIKLSETPATLASAPPMLGEHNEEVLGTILGMSAEQIQALYDKKVISQE